MGLIGSAPAPTSTPRGRARERSSLSSLSLLCVELLCLFQTYACICAIIRDGCGHCSSSLFFCFAWAFGRAHLQTERRTPRAAQCTARGQSRPLQRRRCWCVGGHVLPAHPLPTLMNPDRSCSFRTAHPGALTPASPATYYDVRCLAQLAQLQVLLPSLLASRPLELLVACCCRCRCCPSALLQRKPAHPAAAHPPTAAAAAAAGTRRQCC